MPETDSTRSGKPGAVRIRSNVTVSPDERLVPGDVLVAYGMPAHNMTGKQRDEQMYYEPCCLCGRKINRILADGCERMRCQRTGVPSPEEAARRKAEAAGGAESVAAMPPMTDGG